MIEVSIVIPTYNRLKSLNRVLEALTNQTYPLDDFEVIVVSDGSNDGTDEYLRIFQPPYTFRTIFQSNQGPAAARNNGISQARGKLLLFLDDDVLPTPELLIEHLKVHAQHGENVVAIGPMLSPSDFKMSPWVNWEQEALAKQYRDMDLGKWEPTARQFYTGNSSLARKHLTEIGGFDVSFTRAEDVELAYRLAVRGLIFIYNRDAIGFHYAERSFKSWLSTPYLYGRNDVIFTYEKGQTWLLDTIFEEYHHRNPLIKGLTKLCLDRPKMSSIVYIVLKKVMDVGTLPDSSKLIKFACSGLFNLRYYQGIADQLDGRDVFFKRVQNRFNMAV